MSQYNPRTLIRRVPKALLNEHSRRIQPLRTLIGPVSRRMTLNLSLSDYRYRMRTHADRSHGNGGLFTRLRMVTERPPLSKPLRRKIQLLLWPSRA